MEQLFIWNHRKTRCSMKPADSFLPLHLYRNIPVKRYLTTHFFSICVWLSINSFQFLYMIKLLTWLAISIWGALSSCTTSKFRWLRISNGLLTDSCLQILQWWIKKPFLMEKQTFHFCSLLLMVFISNNFLALDNTQSYISFIMVFALFCSEH